MSLFLCVGAVLGCERKGKAAMGTGRIEWSGSIGEGTSRGARFLGCVYKRRSCQRRKEQAERFLRAREISHVAPVHPTFHRSLHSRPALRSLRAQIRLQRITVRRRFQIRSVGAQENPITRFVDRVGASACVARRWKIAALVETLESSSSLWQLSKTVVTAAR